MPAGKHGSSEITITYDDSPGGTGRVITNFILQIGAARITSEQQASEAFGDVWAEFTPTGRKKVPAIPMSGLWDDTATTGPHIVFIDVDDDPNDATRTLVIVFGNARTFTVETRLTEYAVMGKNGNLTEFEAIAQPTGAAVWS